MIKLCVGVETIDDLRQWQDRRSAERAAKKQSANPYHDTRMTPKRAEEILAGGSIYWVIKHRIQVRQLITGLEQVQDSDGKAMCRIHLDPYLTKVQPRRKRPFQGWRYLAPSDAPPDLDGSSPAHSAELEQALKEALAW